MATTARDLGNNESVSTGVVAEDDGSFLAITPIESVRWLAARGYRADGSRASTSVRTSWPVGGADEDADHDHREDDRHVERQCGPSVSR